MKNRGFGIYLKHSENSSWECVKVGCWSFILKVKPGERTYDSEFPPRSSSDER